VNLDANVLRREHDALLLACGALNHRDLELPGRELRGIHYAMDYLHGVTRSLLDSGFEDGRFLDAHGRHVIVIGGGDTGADCIGTAIRQQCASLLNITRREREPDTRADTSPWPGPTGTYVLDYAHEEGSSVFGRDPREYGVLPLEFIGDGRGRVHAVRIERLDGLERTGIVEDLRADLVLLAIGFTGHDTPGIVRQLGVHEDAGVVTADYGRFATSEEGVFAAGDMRRGASLIVWAIAEGRGAAREIDRVLMGETTLVAPG
jgi:glutamate synthase (NADPH) small chain